MSSRILVILSILGLMILPSCEEFEDLVGYNEYVIPEGKHFSKGEHVDELMYSKLTYDIIFDETAIYKIDNSDQPDWNKLVGFSECNQHHHQNSARFGWRWIDNQLEISAYVYVDDERFFEKIAVLELNQSYRYTITQTPDKYLFTIDGVVEDFEMERGDVCNRGIYYLLYPYFGGNRTAPHDVSIFLRRVYFRKGFFD